MKKLIRTALIAVIALVLLGSLPASVQADSGAIDLELGGEGATSWQIAGVYPGQSGTKTVTLHNAGNADGFVTIWISDIEETDFAGDGAWLDDYVLFGISCNELSTNLSLPVTIHELPQDASGQPNYLKINHLGRGKTVTLIWQWNFLSEAGNEAQGDSFLFTINYMLEGFPAPKEDHVKEPTCKTYLLGKIDGEGVITENVTAKSCDKRFWLIIKEGTTALTDEDRPLSWIIMKGKMRNPPEPPEDANVISLFYDFKPSGATFDPPATLEYRYETNKIPEGVSEEDLVIAYWDATASEWVELTCACNTETKTITAKLAHFTAFSVFGYEVKTVVLPAMLSPEPEPEPALPEPEPAPQEPESILPVSADKFGSLLTWQTIVIFALLAFIIYLLFRRRKQTD